MKRKLLKLTLCLMALLPMGAWAAVNSISSYKLWTFNTLDVASYGGAFPSNTSGSNIDLTGDGVIYTGNSGSSLKTVSPSAIGLTLNGVELGNISQVIRLQESPNSAWTEAFIEKSRNGETYNGTLGRSLAINVTVPGTLYVKVKSTAIADDRNFELLFNPNSDRTYPHEDNNYRYLNTVQPIADTDIHELSVFGDGAGTFWFRAGKMSDVYAILFVPAYTLTTNVSSASAGNVTVETAAISSDYYSSGTAAGTKFYSQNTAVSLNASPNDGYKFISWSGVDSEDGATATVTMNANKNVTATFEKKVATTVWKFDQYAASVALVSSTANSAASEEYTDGLYFHTKSQTSDNHKVVTLERKNEGSAFSSQTTTYAAGSTYMAVQIGKGGSNTVSATDASAVVACDGIAYKAPAAGTFYATFYAGSAAAVAVYKNSKESPASTTNFSNKEGNEISVSVAANDVIYLVNTSSSSIIALLEAGFVPTSADEVTKTVTISTAGIATFSATQNYKWSDDNLKAYVVSSVTESAATMTEVTKENGIPACTGVVFMAPEDTYTLTSAESVTAVGTNMLKANIVDYNLPTGGTGKYNYILTAGGFVPTAGSDSGILSAGKAFLQCSLEPGTSSKLEFVFGEESVTPEDGEETDGIASVEAGMINTGYIYDLSGRRVVAPTKGLYIVNGKKVIIK